MNDSETGPPEEISRILRSVEKRVRRLTVTTMVMTCVMVLLTAAVVGELVNYFAFEPLLMGGVPVVTGLFGFALGWFARRRA